MIFNVMYVGLSLMVSATFAMIIACKGLVVLCGVFAVGLIILFVAGVVEARMYNEIGSSGGRSELQEAG